MALAVVGCKKDEPATDDASRVGAASPADVGGTLPGESTVSNEVAGVRADGSVASAVDWFSGSFDDALRHAKQEEKLVFLHMGAYWCPPCHRLEEEVFTSARIGSLLRDGYVALHVDAEKGEGPELAERYTIQAYPTLLVLEPSGLEKGRVVDFIEADALEVALSRIAGGGDVLAELEAAVEADPDALEVRYTLAHAYALAARREQAEQHYAIVVVGDPADEMGLHSKVLYDRALFFTHKLDDDGAAAIAQLQTLQRRFPDSKAAVRAYRHIGRLLHIDGRSAEAIDSLDRMLATSPDDPGLAASYGWFSFRERCEPRRGLDVVESAIERHPDEAELHYLRAELQHLLGNEAAALEAIQKASALEPEAAFYKRQVRRFADLQASAR